jgi:hypothetical protein
MSEESSTGGTDPASAVKPRATTEGVDAQNPSQLELDHKAPNPGAESISDQSVGQPRPDQAQDDQKHPNNAGRYEAGQQIREIDMPERQPRPGKGGLADNGE